MCGEAVLQELKGLWENSAREGPGESREKGVFGLKGKLGRAKGK